MFTSPRFSPLRAFLLSLAPLHFPPILALFFYSFINSFLSAPQKPLPPHQFVTDNPVTVSLVVRLTLFPHHYLFLVTDLSIVQVFHPAKLFSLTSFHPSHLFFVLRDLLCSLSRSQHRKEMPEPLFAGRCALCSLLWPHTKLSQRHLQCVYTALLLFALD